MSLRLRCPYCHRRLEAPENAAGQTRPCPGCGEPVTAPAPVVLPVRPAWPAKQPDDLSPLTACAACGKAIAKKAATCPRCGAPNEWVHPEVIRFHRAARLFAFAPSVVFSSDKFVLAGVDTEAGKRERELADLANRFGMIGNPLDVLMFHVTREWMNDRANKKIKAFRAEFVDFSNSPPLWSSTDDSYWRDVMDFFALPLPVKQFPR